jgi:hypothetical protein
MEVPFEHAGTLILRVWLEGGRTDGFRARIIRTIGSEQAPPVAVSAVDDVHTVIQKWLDDLLEADE